MEEPKPFSRAATIAARLRPMLPSDLAAVLELEHELFPDDAWTSEMFADEVSQPADARLYLVAENEPPRHHAGDANGEPNGDGAGRAGEASADTTRIRRAHLAGIRRDDVRAGSARARGNGGRADDRRLRRPAGARGSAPRFSAR